MGPAPRRALLVALVSLAGLVALLAGCTVGPSQRPPVAVRGENMPPPPPGATADPDPTPAPPEPDRQNPLIAFRDCTAEMLTAPLPPDRALRVDCAEMTVPADPGRSGGRTQVGVLRVGLADAPADRPPLLAVGDMAGEPSARHAVALAGQVPLAVLERYTLVGLDRRGTGVDAVDCAPAEARAALVDADADAGAAGEAGLAALLEDARAVVQDCYLLLSGGLGGYSTASTAGDVEQLRVELGVARLSAIGAGDGAGALARWAGAFPGSVGRLVLDGPPNPVLDEPERSEARARAVEGAFDAFAVACTARAGCPLGTDPRTAVSELLDRLRDQPLAAADGRRLTAGATVTALLTTLGEPRGWPALATALAAARAGDPSALLATLDPVLGPGGRFDAILATTCNDADRRLTPGEVGELAARWRDAYPLAGGTLALRLLACAPWPAGTAPPPAAPADGAPPILVIGTANDPRGPLEGSRRAAEALPSARFLSWQGAGTGAYPRTPCVSDLVGRLLVDGAAPQSGALCPP